MSLKKKIIIGFLISSVVIVVLAISAYFNFIEIRKEIRYLELSDTVRTKALQLRRYEKNFFLYGMPMDSQNLHRTADELKSILSQPSPFYNLRNLRLLNTKIDEYDRRFTRIENLVTSFHNAFDQLKPSQARYSFLFPLVESSFLERPTVNAEFVQKTFGLAPNHSVVKSLTELEAESSTLRKNGEEILNISNDLDKAAREKVENAILILQGASLVLFPLFLVVGIGTLFVISQNVVSRLKMLTYAVQKAGKGDFSSLEVPEKHDEVGILITAFNSMKKDLRNHDIELTKKNEELHQARKLASIGTLASGVAHELNNPLNNIYISAQILEKETKETSTPIVKEIVNDIVGQTVRVKRIVGDLLEFARGREPRYREIELSELVRGAYKLVGMTADTHEISFKLDSDPREIIVEGDPEQLERVFINLFTNAVDAMSGTGNLEVAIMKEEDFVRIRVSDSGKGMAPEELEKIFEPFYTTKDRGTGLGLAISFNILKKHGGEITAVSRPGQGTTFTIALPGKREHHGS